MKSIHLICNAHLDPVWLWEWQEGAAETLATFRTAADLCEELDGFVFNHNEVILYQWVEEHEPELFERIRTLVNVGKWHIMGGWYLQPDCNMPSGESFVRHALLGKRYFLDRFGVEPKTAINFDPFGHTRGLDPAPEGTIPVVVYNPHPWPIEDCFECEFNLPDQNWRNSFTTLEVFDGEIALPTQVEKELSNLNLDWRKRVVFTARVGPQRPGDSTVGHE